MLKISLIPPQFVYEWHINKVIYETKQNVAIYSTACCHHKGALMHILGHSVILKGN